MEGRGGGKRWTKGKEEEDEERGRDWRLRKRGGGGVIEVGGEAWKREEGEQKV